MPSPYAAGPTPPARQPISPRLVPEVGTQPPLGLGERPPACGMLLDLVTPDAAHDEVLAVRVREVPADTAAPGHIAIDSVSSMPARSVASSRPKRVNFSVWSGQAG